MAKAQKKIDTLPEMGNAEIPLDRLVGWEGNPRRSRSLTGLQSTAASLHTNGQLMPLLVQRVADGDLYKVVDGERRRQSFMINVEAGLMDGGRPVKCCILNADTKEADLIAIATIANIEREQMNPIEQMEAFSAMSRSGMVEREISEQFNISVDTVKQRLALGNLVEGARDLIREGKRHLRWAESMTEGSVAQQERIVAEIAANPQSYIDGQAVKMEITRGNIPVASALFDPNELQDAISRNLFEGPEEGSFRDVEAFWKRQDVEIQKLVEEHSATHKKVDLYKGRRFNDTGWMRGGVAEESVAVIVVKDDGSVTVHANMVPPAGTYDDDDDGSSVFGEAHAMFGEDLEDMPHGGVEGSGDTVKAFDPMAQATRATEAYLEGQVVAALRLRAANDPRISMAFVIAQTLTRHGKLASSMEIPGFNLDSDKRTSAVFNKLEAKRKSYENILGRAGLMGVRSPSRAVELLLGLSEADLLEVFSWTVSQSVNPGLSPIAFETMEIIGEKPLDGWTIDETYIETLSNAQKRALAGEVVPTRDQPASSKSIPVVVRAIIAAVETDALQGDWTGGKEQWLPPQITSMRNDAAERLDAEAEAAQKRIDAEARGLGKAA